MKPGSILLIVIGVVCLIIGLIPLAQVGSSVLHDHWVGDYGQAELPRWTAPFTMDDKFIVDHVTVRVWASTPGDYMLKLSQPGCLVGASPYALSTSHQSIDMPIGNCGWLEPGTYTFYLEKQYSDQSPPGGKVYVNTDMAFVVWGDTYGGYYPPPEGEDCDDGYYWDEDKGECTLKDTSHDCGDDQHWNETDQKCVDDVVRETEGGGEGEEWLSPICLLSLFGIFLIVIGVIRR